MTDIQINPGKPETSDILAFQSKLETGTLGSTFYVTLLGLKTFDVLKLLRSVEAGLAFSTFSRFRRNIDLSTEELAAIVQVTPRTLDRRKRAGRLKPIESDRLLRTSRIFGKTLQLFEGDAAAARAWMSSPVRALGNKSPFSFCRTEFGAHEVERLIGQLEHGVFA